MSERSDPLREPLRVLIVEHDEADAELNVRELERGGFDVRAAIASTRTEFRALLERSAYDVVLADYRLPEWTGMDALFALQELKLDIPFILVTGTLGEERAVECVKQGVADYLLKQNLTRLPTAVRRALAEQRLRDERARNESLIRKLTLAVEQSPAAVIITDTHGTIEYVNRRFIENTGYSEQEVLGQTPRILRSGRTAAATYSEMWRTIKAGLTWHGELENRRKSGELLWDSVSIAPIRDGSRTITHYLATQEDITERKLAEEALREREERFRQIADNIREVFFVVDAQFRSTLYISPAYESIWGRSCQSAYEDPQSILEPIPAEDRVALLENIKQIQQGDVPGDIEFRVVRPNGSVRWILSSAVAIPNEKGEIYRLSGVCMDITERKNAEEQLRDSLLRYHKLTEASFDGIVVTVDGIIREANVGYASTFGYTVDELIGRPMLDLVADESREDVRQRLTQQIDGKFSVIGKRKDGTKVIIEAAARSHTIDGRPGRLTALRDMTEKRNLEEQFRQAQKMEAVGRLAGGVAHDFNNLLTVISSYTDLLSMDLSPNDPRLDDLKQISKAADDAAGLTRQLLAFSRQQVVAPRIVVLEEIVAAAEKMLKRLIGADIQLETALKEPPSCVLLDPSQLDQVILNLAVNARDAMPTGGKLTLETTTVEFDENYARSHWPAIPGRFAMLAVSDTGTGMDEQTRARIFEPFFTTKEPGKGTGLGLATVYGIVKQNGGFIWVYSELGHGTTFKIYLPVAEADARNGFEISADTAESPRGTETIVLAEDAPAVRAAARQILERFGYAVLEAPNGEAALALIAKRQSPIHLLLTDVVMPNMSGRELAERVRAIRPDTKVLYMSSYTDDTIVRHSVIDATAAYLQKPFTPDGLARKVRAVLDAAPSESGR